MKMSDKFDLPLKFKSTPFLKDNSGCNPIYSQSVFSDLDDNDRVDRAEYACYAINNHDRLTEENAKLLELLYDVMGCVNQDSWNTRCDDAKQLLTELGKGQ